MKYAKLLKMSYLDAIKALKQKYGEVSGDYYLTEDCELLNKDIVRLSEGLFIHHDYEYLVGGLSDTFSAVQHPFSYQKAENLTYANLLEHLILHVIIFRDIEPNQTWTLSKNFIPTINDIYSLKCYRNYRTNKYVEAIVNSIYDDKEDYFNILFELINNGFSEPILSSFRSKVMNENSINNELIVLISKFKDYPDICKELMKQDITIKKHYSKRLIKE